MDSICGLAAGDDVGVGVQRGGLYDGISHGDTPRRGVEYR
jgi:hypothetical protein